MKKKALLIALSVIGLSVLLLSAMIPPAAAGSLDVGVKVGDWFKYQRKVTKWVSTDPFLPDGYIGPLSLADNQTTSVLYTVTAIAPDPSIPANNVTFSITYNWQNGSVTTDTLVEAVSTANTDIFEIGANMAAGQMVSDTWSFFGFFDYPQRFINRTFDRPTSTGTAATNELNYSVTIFGSDYNYTFWWDKATGMEVYFENSGDVAAFFTAAYQYTVVYTLVDSSIAGLVVPEYSTGLLMLLVLTASAVPIVLHRRKKILI
jgi:hypothetical protein